MSPTVPRQNPSGASAPPAAEHSADVDPTPRPVPSRELGEVVVLEPVGQLDRAGVEGVRQAATELADRPVVIDLRDCVLTDPNALADLADQEGDPTELCFVSHRPTCRLLLARTGITSRFVVFDQLEDALQARTFAKDGYGRGWRRHP